MKRRVLKLVVFLLLGAIINVAVAWGCAAFIDPNRVPMQVDYTVSFVKGEPNRRIGIQDRFGHTRINRAVGEISELGLALEALNDAGRPIEDRSDRRSEDYAGWPRRALSCFNYGDIRFDYSDYFREYEVTRSHGIASGIQLAPWTTGQLLYQNAQSPRNQIVWRALPWRLVWPGFAINTIFYAAIVWVLFAFPGVVRRRMRAHRGRCVACGYDLRGRGSDQKLCPECGASASKQP